MVAFIMNFLAMLSNLGGPDLIIILLIVLVLFGAKKLPELAKGMGQAVKEFQKAKDDFSDELRNAGNTPAKPDVRAADATVPRIDNAPTAREVTPRRPHQRCGQRAKRNRSELSDQICCGGISDPVIGGTGARPVRDSDDPLRCAFRNADDRGRPSRHRNHQSQPQQPHRRQLENLDLAIVSSSQTSRYF